MGAPVGAMFKTHGGIWQPVYLETRGRAYVEDVFVQPSYRDKQLRVDLAVAGDASLTERVRYRVLDEGHPVLDRSVALTGHQTTELDWEAPTLWWPDAPKLYTLRTELLSADGAVVDRHDQPFGFREVWIEGTGFYLNGKKIHLYGRWTHAPSYYSARLYPPDAKPYYDGSVKVLGGGEYLPPEKLWTAHKARGGINVVRLHCQPMPRVFLDEADRQGFLLIAETALNHRPKTEAAIRHAVNLVKRDRNHPSVIMWSGTNEFEHWKMPRNPQTSQFLAQVRDEMHNADPTRPVSHSGYGPTDGRDDVVNYHYPERMRPDMSNWPNELFWSVDSGECRKDQVLANLNWKQDKPLMLGEMLPPWRMNYEEGYGQAFFTLTPEQKLWLDLEQKPYWFSRALLVYRMLDILHVGQSIGGPGYVDNPMKRRMAELAYATVGGLFYPWTGHWYAGEPIEYELWLSNIGLEDFRGGVTFRLVQGDHVLQEVREDLEIAQGGTAKVPVTMTVSRAAGELGDELRLTAHVVGTVGDEAIDTKMEQSIRICPADRPITGLHRRVVVWAGDRVDSTSTVLQDQFADVTPICDAREIDQLDATQTIFVLPGGLPVQTQETLSRSLAHFVERGGRVLVLEQDAWAEGWLPVDLNLVEDANNTLYPGAPGDVFSALPNDTLTYWRGDHRVVRKPIAGLGSGPAAALIDFPAVAVAQIRHGDGLYVLSQALVQEKLGVEPMAAVLLERLLIYADRAEVPVIRPAYLWAGEGSRYAEALTKIGVEFAGSGAQLPSNSLDENDQVLVDAATVDLASLASLRPWIERGGRLVLHNLSDDQVAHAGGLLSLSIKAGTSESRVQLQEAPLNRGMSPYRLSFGKTTWPLAASPIDVGSEAGAVERGSLPMLWGTIPLGQGEVVFDQVRWDREPEQVQKALLFGATLMGNLGVTLASLPVTAGQAKAWVPVDLSTLYTAGITTNFDKDSPNHQVARGAKLLRGAWPRGRQVIAGVDVILPDPGGEDEKCLIRLNTQRVNPDGERLETLPDGPTRVRVPMKRVHAEELAFVHGYLRLWGEPYEPPRPPATVMTYRVIYDSGRTADVPVRAGEEIRHFNGQADPLPHGELAFSTHEQAGEDAGEISSYYLLRWRNPYPAEKIESIEVIAEQHPAYVPVVLAISYCEYKQAYD
jgi:Glycosyl hydrolases family 2/Glycosyl hydrolases family 2, TIM barrel domain